MDPNFIGYWEAYYGTIRIEENLFRSEYYYYDGFISSNSTGTARVNEKRNILKIGAKKLYIDQYPAYESTLFDCEIWRMVLEGEVYEKKVCN